MNWYHNATDGRLMEREFVFSPIRLETHQGDFFDFALKSQYQRITGTFRLLDREIDPGEYKYSRFVVIGGTDPSKKVSTTVDYEGGKFFNGRLNTLNASLLFIPMSQINLKGSFLRNEFKILGRMELRAR